MEPTRGAHLAHSTSFSPHFLWALTQFFTILLQADRIQGSNISLMASFFVVFIFFLMASKSEALEALKREKGWVMGTLWI